MPELKPRKLLLKLFQLIFNLSTLIRGPVFEHVWECIRSASSNVSGLVFAHANINISTCIVRAIRVCLNRRDSPAFLRSLPSLSSCPHFPSRNHTPSTYTRCFMQHGQHYTTTGKSNRIWTVGSWKYIRLYERNVWLTELKAEFPLYHIAGTRWMDADGTRMKVAVHPSCSCKVKQCKFGFNRTLLLELSSGVNPLMWTSNNEM